MGAADRVVRPSNGPALDLLDHLPASELFRGGVRIRIGVRELLIVFRHLGSPPETEAVGSLVSLLS